MGFFTPHDHSRSVAVFDVGSDAVSGAYAHLMPQQRPVVRAAVHVPVSMQRTPKTREQNVLHSLQQASSRLAQETIQKGGGAPDYVYVFLAGPWHVPRVCHTGRIFTEPRQFDNTLLRELYQDSQKSFEHKTNHKIIDKALITARINGYPMENAPETYASAVDATFFCAYVPATFMERANNAIAHASLFENPQWHTRARTLAQRLHNVTLPTKSYHFFDLGSTHSEHLVVKGGHLDYIETIPLGYTHLLHNLAHHQHLSEEMLNSYLNGWAGGAVRLNPITENVLTTLTRAWLLELTDTLIGDSAPKGGEAFRTFMAVPHAVRNWFWKLLRRQASQPPTPFGDTVWEKGLDWRASPKVLHPLASEILASNHHISSG